jgi:hypothetical protein
LFGCITKKKKGGERCPRIVLYIPRAHLEEIHKYTRKKKEVSESAA